MALQPHKDSPHYDHEQECINQGYQCIAGLDEVGRGCLAGPVVAAAVVFSPEKIPQGLMDSKKLSAAQRERLDVEIRQLALGFAIGVGEVEEIDTINILNASKNAMVRAVDGIKTVKPDFLLVDGNFKIPHALPQKFIIKGDQISVSIAAASIIAKVYRDNLMREFESLYPGYHFAQHKGYGSEAHRRAMQEKGITPIHRKTFSWKPISGHRSSTSL